MMGGEGIKQCLFLEFFLKPCLLKKKKTQEFVKQWGRDIPNRRDGFCEDPEEEAGPLRKTGSCSAVEVGRRRVRVETCLPRGQDRGFMATEGSMGLVVCCQQALEYCE